MQAYSGFGSVELLFGIMKGEETSFNWKKMAVYFSNARLK
jgi:hypothetical protein